jgi:hypothetical protein
MYSNYFIKNYVLCKHSVNFGYMIKKIAENAENACVSRTKISGLTHSGREAIGTLWNKAARPPCRI